MLGCGPKGNAPSVPGTEDSQPAVSETPAQPMLNTSSPYDATVAHRLEALPSSLRDKVLACETAGTFFNLGDQACTEFKLVAYACVINEEFRTRLDPSTLSPLDDYLMTKAHAHRLYACTEEGANITLHFYNLTDGVVNYKKLNIARKAD